MQDKQPVTVTVYVPCETKDANSYAVEVWDNNEQEWAYECFADKQMAIVLTPDEWKEIQDRINAPKDEWIRVKDLLPELPTEENFNWVNVSNGDDIYLSAGYWDGKDWYLYGSAQTIDTITHWKPLQTPPIK
jgi:hypothetical protein